MLESRFSSSIEKPILPKKKKVVKPKEKSSPSFSIYTMFENGEVPAYESRTFDANSKIVSYAPLVDMEHYPDCCGMKIIHGMRRYEFSVFKKDLPILIDRAKKGYCGMVICVCSLEEQKEHIDLLKKSGFVCVAAATNPLHSNASSFVVCSLTLGKVVAL